MAVDNKEVKEFEDKYKKELRSKIGEISSQQHEILSQIYDLSKYVDVESDLPNLGNTLNNKLVELQHEFKNAGISMYSQKFEDYGIMKSDFLGSSFIGDAIISDLLNYASEGTQKLIDFNKKIKEVTDKNVERVQGLKKVSLARRLLIKIWNFFVPVEQEDLSDRQEETESVNFYLSEYRHMDQQLMEYNLRDNIINSIVRKIREQGYRAYEVPVLLKECIIPDLQKLGLVDLILELQQALIKEYKKDLPGFRRYRDDLEEFLHIPNFAKTDKDSDGQLAETAIGKGMGSVRDESR